MCSASAVMTLPVTSSGSSRGLTCVISFVFPLTSVWARTSRSPVTAAIRCTCRPSAPTAPRAVFPSMATSSLQLPSPAAARQPRSAPSRAIGSVRASDRRIVVSLGTASRPRQSRRVTPAAASASGDAAAACSAIAVSDRHPAMTAVHASARIAASVCRRPRTRRGSGTRARNSSSPGSSPSPLTPARRSRSTPAPQWPQQTRAWQNQQSSRGLPWSERN
jgi:hypothetical protein